jgi:hypothetical protein
LQEDWEESPSSPTLSQKAKEEPAVVVALQVVLHEATSKLNLAIGVLVLLFDDEVKVVMILRTISFSKQRSFGRKWCKYVVKTS